MSSTAMKTSLKDRYIASMVLSGVGDALGYKNGCWEFCHSGLEIHKELEALGGLQNIHIKIPNWIVSDDTVMHLATAEALVEWGTDTNKEKLYSLLAKHYQLSMDDMDERAPGACCSSSCFELKPDLPNGYKIPFNERGGGCGAAMRAMCIGLRYPRPEDLDDLITVSVEAGRMTHHHPTGYLGSTAAALFTAYAQQGKPLKEWGRGLLDILPKTLEYVKSRGDCVEENKAAWSYFEDKWTDYLKQRNILDGQSEPVYPEQYGIKDRDTFYYSLSYRGFAGSSGHDAPMIAYDALLISKDWSDLCSRSMFHAGDSDSTGVIAACCYGAMHGFDQVPMKNHKDVEYRARLVKVAEAMYYLSHPEESDPKGDATAPLQVNPAPLQVNSGHLQVNSATGQVNPATGSDLLDVPELPRVPSNEDLRDIIVPTKRPGDISLEQPSKRLQTLHDGPM